MDLHYEIVLQDIYALDCLDERPDVVTYILNRNEMRVGFELPDFLFSCGGIGGIGHEQVPFAVVDIP